MKHMTRVLALLLALVLCLGLSVTAFATEAEQATNGSITVNNAVSGQTYTIYRILELESYNPNSGAYAYKVTHQKWKDFLTNGEGKNYFKIDDQEYATWTGGTDDASVAAFAKAALAYAQDTNNGISYNKTTTATSTTVTFDNLPLGYYLVDSTVGTLCALGTTNSNVIVADKHTAPIIDKQVMGNSTDNYDKANDVSIGDTVNLRSPSTLRKAHRTMCSMIPCLTV